MYQAAVEKMFIEESLPRTKEALKTFVMNDKDCSNVKKYLKSVESEGCRFKTPDGLWWDTGKALGYNMSRAIVSFKRENLTHKDAIDTKYKAFVFVTSIDESGSIRVNDVEYEKQNGGMATQQETQKVWAYLNGEEFDFALNTDAPCFDCVYKNLNSETSSDFPYMYENIEKYDENGNLIYRKHAGAIGVTVVGCNEHFYTYNEKGQKTSSSANCNRGTKTTYEYRDDGKISKEYYCDSNGVCTVSTIYTYDERGNLIAENNYDYKGELSGVQYEYTYDDNNKMIGKVQEALNTGIRSEFTYDEYGNTVETKRYNSEGNLLMLSTSNDITYENGKIKTEVVTNLKTGAINTINYSYDSSGNMTNKKANSYEYNYTYNKNNQITSEEYVSTSGASHSYKYEYDDNGKMISETKKIIESDGTVKEDYKKTFEYDEFGMSYTTVCDYTRTKNQCSSHTTTNSN